MNHNKVIGTLYGAAHGDSRGAMTEFCTQREILSYFPDGCDGYYPSISRITHDIIPGSVTDDFGSSIYVMQTILKHNGEFNEDIAIEAILNWSHDAVVYAKYAGQNSKSSLERLRKGVVIDESSKAMHFSRANTNGGAMKVSPIALLAQGDHSLAVQYAKDLCWPTHYNSAAVSGAAAIACAITETLNAHATLESIYDAAINGAKKARIDLEIEGFDSFGPFVDARITDAITKGQTCNTLEELMELLNSTVGTGIWVQESIPAVFAIIAACEGDYDKSLYAAVNAGGDTDTIASMTCAILGGYHGIEKISKDDISLIHEVNNDLRLEQTIIDFTKLITR